MAAWYRVLPAKTMAHIYVASFELIIHLLLKRSPSAILVQSLADKWWDTTYTFHITNREMTVTPCDFHRMISLRCNGPLILGG